jgi:hypothetical protein
MYLCLLHGWLRRGWCGLLLLHVLVLLQGCGRVRLRCLPLLLLIGLLCLLLGQEPGYIG